MDDNLFTSKSLEKNHFNYAFIFPKKLEDNIFELAFSGTTL